MGSRSQRLDALLALLGQQNGVTVAELAEELEVSQRTLFRDLAELRERGVEIDGDPGPGGGLRLSRSAPLPPIRLDPDEAVALWINIQLAQRIQGLPFAHRGRRALNKVFAALPADRRRDLKRLESRIVVGPPASATLASGACAPQGDVLPTFERAFHRRVGLQFNYADRHGQRTRRMVEPHGLLVQEPVWYVIAFDPGRDARRTFRMDRMTEVRLCARHTFVPSAALVKAAWDELKRHYEGEA